ncbi:MAG TPA: hypothetical protein DIV86_06115 [Alphaproteobacteria bacterium]|nr:hypothetical protein [Alphaproteobacteria bacterium]
MTFKATFLLGLPDNGMVKVSGNNKTGNISYNILGNAEFHNYVQLPQKNKNSILIAGTAPLPRLIKKTDIIVNCITDKDGTENSLKKVIHITNSVKKTHPHIPIFNDPSKIGLTTRDKIYQQFNKMPGLYVPKVVRIKPDSAKDVLRLAKENELRAPFLIRPCGSHESKNLLLIDSKEKTKLLEQYAYDGSEFYLTEFVDYKTPENLYHKARLVIIGGQFYPRHFMTGESWMVHGNLHETYMANNKLAKAREIHFLKNFRKMIAPEALNSMMKIYQRIGLDYLGFDFSIRADGNILIFEINPAQNPFMAVNFKNFPYMQIIRNNIIAALNNCILEKVNKSTNA